MKKTITAVIAGAMLTAGQACAVENWVPYTDGSGMGAAGGALPPPGLYFQNIGFFAPVHGHDNSGNYNGVDITGYVDIPILLYVPDITILGAQYAFGIVQPFDHMDRSYQGETVSASGFFETIILPVNLSWTLAGNWHVSTGLGVYLPDGTFNDKSIAGYLNSCNFWGFEPYAGVSWLSDGWNVSAKLLIDFNGRNPMTTYVSGDVFNVDFGVTKTIGKWILGAGGYWRYQFDNDTQESRTILPGGNRVEEFGLGPIVGYNFDAFTFEVYYERALFWKNEVAGDRLFTRLTVPLYTPEKVELASFK